MRYPGPSSKTVQPRFGDEADPRCWRHHGHVRPRGDGLGAADRRGGGGHVDPLRPEREQKTGGNDGATGVIADYRRKRDLVFERLSRKFEVVKPEGAFYIFPTSPGGLNATAFVEKANSSAQSL